MFVIAAKRNSTFIDDGEIKLTCSQKTMHLQQAVRHNRVPFCFRRLMHPLQQSTMGFKTTFFLHQITTKLCGGCKSSHRHQCWAYND